MAASALISIEEYLRTSYTPDREYIDGDLKEKPVVGFLHGRVQALISQWIGNQEEEWAVQVAVETRTHVQPRRYRLPDVVVVNLREHATGALESPPLIAIEVLSPEDAYSDLEARAMDLFAMGCRNIWLIDPGARQARVWSGSDWTKLGGSILQATDSPVFVDLGWLWSRLPASSQSDRDPSPQG